MVKAGWRSITAVIDLLHAVTRGSAYKVHAPVQDIASTILSIRIIDLVERIFKAGWRTSSNLPAACSDKRRCLRDTCANAGYSVSSWFYPFELLTKLSDHAHGQSWMESDNSGN